MAGSQVEQQLTGLRQKIALPVMVQQLIWIAAEDGTACDGSAAKNLDCGRGWHHR
jgi:hypothetical protein